jgi:hypothetical protein
MGIREEGECDSLASFASCREMSARRRKCPGNRGTLLLKYKEHTPSEDTLYIGNRNRPLRRGQISTLDTRHDPARLAAQRKRTGGCDSCPVGQGKLPNCQGTRTYDPAHLLLSRSAGY